ncbi:UNVERIFIED_CONTAM: hypothetical protein HHA_223725 [Hammondia hammondi]|eukprot:XP_008881759.1 hypothetical protein HHA_223725 [Hammondia hammondi]
MERWGSAPPTQHGGRRALPRQDRSSPPLRKDVKGVSPPIPVVPFSSQSGSRSLGSPQGNYISYQHEAASECSGKKGSHRVPSRSVSRLGSPSTGMDAKPLSVPRPLHRSWSTNPQPEHGHSSRVSGSNRLSRSLTSHTPFHNAPNTVLLVGGNSASQRRRLTDGTYVPIVALTAPPSEDRTGKQCSSSPARQQSPESRASSANHHSTRHSSSRGIQKSLSRSRSMSHHRSLQNSHVDIQKSHSNGHNSHGSGHLSHSSRYSRHSKYRHGHHRSSRSPSPSPSHHSRHRDISIPSRSRGKVASPSRNYGSRTSHRLHSRDRKTVENPRTSHDSRTGSILPDFSLSPSRYAPPISPPRTHQTPYELDKTVPAYHPVAHYNYSERDFSPRHQSPRPGFQPSQAIENMYGRGTSRVHVLDRPHGNARVSDTDPYQAGISIIGGKQLKPIRARSPHRSRCYAANVDSDGRFSAFYQSTAHRTFSPSGTGRPRLVTRPPPSVSRCSPTCAQPRRFAPLDYTTSSATRPLRNPPVYLPSRRNSPSRRRFSPSQEGGSHCSPVGGRSGCTADSSLHDCCSDIPPRGQWLSGKTRTKISDFCRSGRLTPATGCAKAAQEDSFFGSQTNSSACQGEMHPFRRPFRASSSEHCPLSRLRTPSPLLSHEHCHGAINLSCSTLPSVCGGSALPVDLSRRSARCHPVNTNLGDCVTQRKPAPCRTNSPSDRRYDSLATEYPPPPCLTLHRLTHDERNRLPRGNLPLSPGRCTLQEPTDEVEARRAVDTAKQLLKNASRSARVRGNLSCEQGMSSVSCTREADSLGRRSPSVGRRDFASSATASTPFLESQRSGCSREFCESNLQVFSSAPYPELASERTFCSSHSLSSSRRRPPCSRRPDTETTLLRALKSGSSSLPASGSSSNSTAPFLSSVSGRIGEGSYLGRAPLEGTGLRCSHHCDFLDTRNESCLPERNNMETSSFLSVSRDKPRLPARVSGEIAAERLRQRLDQCQRVEECEDGLPAFLRDSGGCIDRGINADTCHGLHAARRSPISPLFEASRCTHLSEVEAIEAEVEFVEKRRRARERGQEDKRTEALLRSFTCLPRLSLQNAKRIDTQQKALLTARSRFSAKSRLPGDSEPDAAACSDLPESQTQHLGSVFACGHPPSPYTRQPSVRLESPLGLYLGRSSGRRIPEGNCPSSLGTPKSNFETSVSLSSDASRAQRVAEIVERLSRVQEAECANIRRRSAERAARNRLTPPGMNMPTLEDCRRANACTEEKQSLQEASAPQCAFPVCPLHGGEAKNLRTRDEEWKRDQKLRGTALKLNAEQRSQLAAACETRNALLAALASRARRRREEATARKSRSAGRHAERTDGFQSHRHDGRGERHLSPSLGSPLSSRPAASSVPNFSMSSKSCPSSSCSVQTASSIASRPPSSIHSGSRASSPSAASRSLPLPVSPPSEEKHPKRSGDPKSSEGQKSSRDLVPVQLLQIPSAKGSKPPRRSGSHTSAPDKPASPRHSASPKDSPRDLAPPSRSLSRASSAANSRTDGSVSSSRLAEIKKENEGDKKQESKGMKKAEKQEKKKEKAARTLSPSPTVQSISSRASSTRTTRNPVKLSSSADAPHAPRKATGKMGGKRPTKEVWDKIRDKTALSPVPSANVSGASSTTSVSRGHHKARSGNKELNKTEKKEKRAKSAKTLSPSPSRSLSRAASNSSTRSHNRRLFRKPESAQEGENTAKTHQTYTRSSSSTCMKEKRAREAPPGEPNKELKRGASANPLVGTSPSKRMHSKKTLSLSPSPSRQQRPSASLKKPKSSSAHERHSYRRSVSASPLPSPEALASGRSVSGGGSARREQAQQKEKRRDKDTRKHPHGSQRLRSQLHHSHDKKSRTDKSVSPSFSPSAARSRSHSRVPFRSPSHSRLTSSASPSRLASASYLSPSRASSRGHGREHSSSSVGSKRHKTKDSERHKRKDSERHKRKDSERHKRTKDDPESSQPSRKDPSQAGGKGASRGQHRLAAYPLAAHAPLTPRELLPLSDCFSRDGKPRAKVREASSPTTQFFSSLADLLSPTSLEASDGRERSPAPTDVVQDTLAKAGLLCGSFASLFSPKSLVSDEAGMKRWKEETRTESNSTLAAGHKSNGRGEETETADEAPVDPTSLVDSLLRELRSKVEGSSVSRSPLLTSEVRLRDLIDGQTTQACTPGGSVATSQATSLSSSLPFADAKATLSFIAEELEATSQLCKRLSGMPQSPSTSSSSSSFLSSSFASSSSSLSPPFSLQDVPTSATTAHSSDSSRGAGCGRGACSASPPLVFSSCLSVPSLVSEAADGAQDAALCSVPGEGEELLFTGQETEETCGEGSGRSERNQESEARVDRDSPNSGNREFSDKAETLDNPQNLRFTTCPVSSFSSYSSSLLSSSSTPCSSSSSSSRSSSSSASSAPSSCSSSLASPSSSSSSSATASSSSSSSPSFSRVSCEIKGDTREDEHSILDLSELHAEQDAASVRAVGESASESLSPFLSTAAEIRLLLPDKEEVAALFSFVPWKRCFSAHPSKRRRLRRNARRGAEALTSAWRGETRESLLGAAATHLRPRPCLAEVALGSFSLEQKEGDQGDEDAGDRETGDGHSEEETEAEDEEVEDSKGQRRKPASTKLRDLLRAFRDTPGEAAHPAAEETETEEVEEEERQEFLQRQGASERGDTADDDPPHAEAPSSLDEAAIEDLWLLQQTSGETRKLLDNVFLCSEPATSAAFDGREAASSPSTFWRPRGAVLSPRRRCLPFVCERRQAEVERGETEEGALERQEVTQHVQTLRSDFTGSVCSFLADCSFFSVSTPRSCLPARRRPFSSSGSPCRRADRDGEREEIQPRRRAIRQLPQKEEKATEWPASPVARALPSSACRRREEINLEEAQTKEEEHGETGKVEESLLSAEGGEEEGRGRGAKKLNERETKQEEEEKRQRPEGEERPRALESSRESRSVLGSHGFASTFRTSTSSPPLASSIGSENALGKRELKEEAVPLQIDANPTVMESGEGRSVEVPEPAEEGRMASATQNGPGQNEKEVFEKKPTEPRTGINEQEHASALRSSALTAVHPPDDRPMGKETGDEHGAQPGERLGERKTGHGEEEKRESDPEKREGALHPSVLQGETRVSEERSKTPPLLSEDSQDAEEEHESITGSFSLPKLSSSISGKHLFRQSGLKTPEADILASPACSEFTFAIDFSPQASERAGAGHMSASQASSYSALSSETRQSPENESVSKGFPQTKLALPRSRVPSSSSSLSSSSSSASSVCVSSSSSASSFSASSTILSFSSSSSSSVPSLSSGPSSSTPSSSSFGCDESELPARVASSASAVEDRMPCLSGDQNVERAANETEREATTTKTSDETLEAAGTLGDTPTKASACGFVADGEVDKMLADAGDEAPSCPPHSEGREGDSADKAREPPPVRLLTSDSAAAESHAWLGSSVCIWEADEGEKYTDASAQRQTRTCAIQATDEDMCTLHPLCAAGPGVLLYAAIERQDGQREMEVNPRALLHSPLGSQAGGGGSSRSRLSGAERGHAPGRERGPLESEEEEYAAKEAVTTRASAEDWRHVGVIEKFRKVCFLERLNSASVSKTYAVEKPLAHPGPSLEASHEDARDSGESAENERKGRTRHSGGGEEDAKRILDRHKLCSEETHGTPGSVRSSRLKRPSLARLKGLPELLLRHATHFSRSPRVVGKETSRDQTGLSNEELTRDSEAERCDSRSTRIQTLLSQSLLPPKDAINLRQGERKSSREREGAERSCRRNEHEGAATSPSSSASLRQPSRISVGSPSRPASSSPSAPSSVSCPHKPPSGLRRRSEEERYVAARSPRCKSVPSSPQLLSIPSSFLSRSDSSPACFRSACPSLARVPEDGEAGVAVPPTRPCLQLASDLSSCSAFVSLPSTGPRRAGSDASAERRKQNTSEEKNGDGGLCRFSPASGREPQRVSLPNVAFQRNALMRAGVSPVPSKSSIFSPASLPASFQVFSTPRNLSRLSDATPRRTLRSRTTPESLAGSPVSSPVEDHSLASSSLSSPPCERLPDDPVDRMRLVKAKLRFARAAQRGLVSSARSASPGKMNEEGHPFPRRSAASEGQRDDSQRFFQFLRKTFEAGGEGKNASLLRPRTSSARPPFVSGSSPFSPLFACSAFRQSPAPQAVTLTPEDKAARDKRCRSASATREGQRVAALPVPHRSLPPVSLLPNPRGASSAIAFQRLPAASCSDLAGELLAAEWATRKRGKGDKQAVFRDEERAWADRDEGQKEGSSTEKAKLRKGECDVKTEEWFRAVDRLRTERLATVRMIRGGRSWSDKRKGNTTTEAHPAIVD